MIIVSLGANIAPENGTPRAALEAAIAAMGREGLIITARSRWYASAPVPASSQPDYVNGAVLVESGLDPWHLLARLHRIEAEFGRTRSERWGARTLDLDLIDYHGFATFNGWQSGRPGRPGELCLPHPRAHERAFVLRPLMDIAPHWRHPVLGVTAAALLRGPVALQRCAVME